MAKNNLPGTTRIIRDGKPIESGNAIADMLKLSPAVGAPELPSPAEAAQVDGESESNSKTPAPLSAKDRLLARERELELLKAAVAQEIADLEHEEWLAETKDAHELHVQVLEPLIAIRRDIMADLKWIDGFIETTTKFFPDPRAPKVEAAAPAAPPRTPGVRNGETSRETQWDNMDFGRQVPNKKGTMVWAADWVTELTPAQYELLKSGKRSLSHIQMIEAWSPTIAHIRAHGHTVHGEIDARMVCRTVFGKTQPVTPIHWGTTKEAYLADPKSASAPLTK